MVEEVKSSIVEKNEIFKYEKLLKGTGHMKEMVFCNEKILTGMTFPFEKNIEMKGKK